MPKEEIVCIMESWHWYKLLFISCDDDVVANAEHVIGYKDAWRDDCRRDKAVVTGLS